MVDLVKTSGRVEEIGVPHVVVSGHRKHGSRLRVAITRGSSVAAGELEKHAPRVDMKKKDTGTRED